MYPNEIDHIIGANLASARKQRSISLDMISVSSNIPAATLALAEQGMHRLNVVELYGLCVALDVQPILFFKGLFDVDQPENY